MDRFDQENTQASPVIDFAAAEAGRTVATPAAPAPKGKHEGPRRDRRWLLAVVVVTALSAFLRVGPLTSALPYTSYIDEGFVLRPSAHMVAQSTWDPGWYRYPSLLMDGTALITKVYGAVSPSVARQAATTDENTDDGTIEPASMIVIGRTLVLLSSLGTVVVTMLLGRRLAGRAVGVVSGLVVGVLPALAVRSAIVIVDTPATFFVMASILAAAGATDRSRRGLMMSIGSGALAGLALSSKYTSGAVILVVLVVLAFATTLDVTQRAKRALGASVAMVAAAVLTTPALLLRTSEVREAIEGQSEIYRDRSTPSGYLQQLFSAHEVGWIITTLSLAGLVVLLARKRSRVLVAGWIAFSLVLLLPLLRFDYQQFRNVLPLVPFLGILTGAAVVAAVEAVGRVRSWDSRAKSAVMGLCAVVLVTFVFLTATRPAIQPWIGVTDSRTKAVDWLVANTHDGQRVLVAEQLEILPSELDRIPGQVTVASIEEQPPAPDPGTYDMVVTSVFTPPVPGWSSAWRGAPTTSFGFRPVPESGWHGANELIQIYTSSP